MCEHWQILVLWRLSSLLDRFELVYCKLTNAWSGWITTIAWIATLATGGFITGTTIQGLIVLNYPNYNYLPVHGTLLTWAVLLVAVFVNTVVGSLLPKIEGVILVLHVLGFFAIMIPLVYSAPHSTASAVFTTFLNEGMWPTQGISFCVGIIGAVASFVGRSNRGTKQLLILIFVHSRRRCRCPCKMTDMQSPKTFTDI